MAALTVTLSGHLVLGQQTQPPELPVDVKDAPQQVLMATKISKDQEKPISIDAIGATIKKYVESKGGKAVGMPIVRDKGNQWEIGLPVKKAVLFSKSIYSVVIPATKTAHVLYIGDRSGMKSAFATAQKWIIKNKKMYNGEAWGVPERQGPVPDQTRLDVYFPFK